MTVEIIADMKSLQLVLQKKMAETFSGKRRSPVVAGKVTADSFFFFLRALSSYDRVCDSDQNRDDYCIKWLYNSSKWDVEKTEHRRQAASDCVILPTAATFL